MTYDAARDRVVLFGGSQGGGTTDATWEWDGLRWTRMPPSSTGPSARTGARMAYDASRKAAILYGGDGRDDTWSWDGRAWSRVDGRGPGLRAHHAMAYDPVRSRIVVFGGYDGRNNLNDTWEFDGSSWAQVATGN
jgi:hypothetical protein